MEETIVREKDSSVVVGHDSVGYRFCGMPFSHDNYHRKLQTNKNEHSDSQEIFYGNIENIKLYLRG